MTGNMMNMQDTTGKDMNYTNAAAAAIQFALTGEEGMAYLRCWNEGNFEACRREWPEAPEDCYIGADPLHPLTKVELCKDEGCPHHGADHVCVSGSEKASDWARDAREYGPALNTASWALLDGLPTGLSPDVFNNAKGALRAAILKYAEQVSK